MRRFEGGVDAGEAEAYKAYVEMLGKTREVLGIAQDQYCPHNVVMTREWMVVIPRRKGQVEGLGVNAASMMGLVTVKDRGEYERWKSVGVERLLEEAGVAR
jgi:ATP adenylyltransferase